MKTAVKLTYEGSEYSLSHGSVVIAAITSCTNTSNPSVMLGAGRYCRLHIWTYMSTVTIIISIIYGHILCNWTVSAQACFFPICPFIWSDVVASINSISYEWLE